MDWFQKPENDGSSVYHCTIVSIFVGSGLILSSVVLAMWSSYKIIIKLCPDLKYCIIIIGHYYQLAGQQWSWCWYFWSYYWWVTLVSAPADSSGHVWPGSCCQSSLVSITCQYSSTSYFPLVTPSSDIIIASSVSTASILLSCLLWDKRDGNDCYFYCTVATLTPRTYHHENFV